MKTSQRQAVGVVTAFTFISSAFFISLQIRAGARQSQAPVFKSKVEIVQLDVSVLDKHRQPIKGLTEKDFTILEDGKPQKIVGFSAFDIDAGPAPATGWMKDVPPDVTTNDLKPEARLWVIVMDDAMTPQDPFGIKSSKEIASTIIDKLAPADLAAIVFTGDNRKTQDFTSDKTKLRAALDKFNPGLAGYRFGLDTHVDQPSGLIGANAKPGTPPDQKEKLVDTDLWFYQSAVRTLGNVAEFLAGVPNRRKALFWVSPGVPMDLINCVPSSPTNPPPCGTSPAGLPPEIWIDMQHRLDDIFLIAQRANVTMYPIDPMGLAGMQTYLARRLGPGNELVAEHKAETQHDFLFMTAANTGGRAILNINEFGPEIGEVFDENKSYYYLAIEPANPVADGKLHKLKVEVDRPDVEVRTRSGYWAPEAESKEDKKIAKAGMTPDAVALAKAMGGILPTAGMPMRASAAAFAVPGQRLSAVAIVLGVTQPVSSDAANGRVTETTELQTTAFTPEGDAKGSQRHTAKVVLRAGSNGTASYEVLARIDLPPGRYQLRLAAHNSTAAKDGSVFVDVIVPDFANAPFSASQVVLSATPGRVSAPKDLFSPLLPLVPTAERTFGQADRVTAFMRLYQSGQKPIDKVAVTMTVRDEKNDIKATQTQTFAADQFATAGQQVANDTSTLVGRTGSPINPATAPAADKFANLSLRTADVKYVIQTAQLAARPHLLTIEATLGTTTIRRDVRFDIR